MVASVPRAAGTPQGGVVSPILANLFLHYAFDLWMGRNFCDIPFERYADDVICHCRSAEGARALWSALEARFTACRLVLHPCRRRSSSTARIQTDVVTFRTTHSTFSVTRFDRERRAGAAVNTAFHSC